jgi:hypothetical protein
VIVYPCTVPQIVSVFVDSTALECLHASVRSRAESLEAVSGILYAK